LAGLGEVREDYPVVGGWVMVGLLAGLLGGIYPDLVPSGARKKVSHLVATLPLQSSGAVSENWILVQASDRVAAVQAGTLEHLRAELPTGCAVGAHRSPWLKDPSVWQLYDSATAIVHHGMCGECGGTEKPPCDASQPYGIHLYHIEVVSEGEANSALHGEDVSSRTWEADKTCERRTDPAFALRERRPGYYLHPGGSV
jgi:hypothetical protein